MAITDIKTFAHLAESDVESFAAELDAVRRDVERSLGAQDAAYVTRVIKAQRILEVAARAMLSASKRRPAWLVGTALLAVAKIIEMMELGHNISHGQWDWMNDPEIHSSSWEWDFASPSSQWKNAHNHIHHKYTNVYGMDEDLGFAVLRMTRDEPWRPVHLVQPVTAIGIAAFLEWAIAVHDWAITRRLSDTPGRHQLSTPNRELARKFGRQIGKDLLIYPALTGRAFRRTLSANAAALLARNLWSFVVIMCGHFPDGAEKFTSGELVGETRGQWYLRQLLGTANFEAGPALAFMSGNLCYQIEHHLFLDLPSNRYAEIADRVRALCDKYDIPYTTGSLPKQFWLTSRTIYKLALPDRFLRRTSDDAPETSSERKFLAFSLPSTRDVSGWHGSDRSSASGTVFEPPWQRPVHRSGMRSRTGSAGTGSSRPWACIDRTAEGKSLTQQGPVVRIVAGVAGRSLSLMAGMTIGAVDALAARRVQGSRQELAVAPLQPVVVGVSGGAIGGAAAALGMTRDEARRIAVDYPEENVLGKKSFRALLTRRALYPEARVRELAYAVVGDRTFADFALTSQPPGLRPHETASSLIIPVYSAKHGTLLLPRDLPTLGLTDLPVADVLVAATRIPGALPAAAGLEDVFDGGCQYRVPHEVFSPHPALVMDLYGPQPYNSRGGLIFPLLHPSLPPIPNRPRPFHDRSLRESTIFAHQPYGSALQATARQPGQLFDCGYEIATSWIDSRTDEQLRNVVGSHVFGLPDETVAAS